MTYRFDIPTVGETLPSEDNVTVLAVKPSSTPHGVIVLGLWGEQFATWFYSRNSGSCDQGEYHMADLEAATIDFNARS